MKSLMLALLCLTAVVHASDSVWTEPANPTTRDSITFHLYLENNCCCTQYHNKYVSVEDTVIYLGHEVDNRLCQACRCVAPGSWVEFATAPLAEGRYAVYSAGQMYCPPGTICPLGMMAPVRVGELVVTGSSGIVPMSTMRTGSDSPRTGVRYTLDGRPVKHSGNTGLVVESSGALRFVSRGIIHP